MPPWPIAMPSSTAIVLNSRGIAPASRIAARHHVAHLAQMHVTGDELGEAVGHRDDGLAEVAARYAGRPEQGPGTDHVPAVGDRT